MVRKTGESEFVPFDQNLLIPVDLSRLRQIVIKLVRIPGDGDQRFLNDKLVSSLLTEGLLVRN
jgi:hypothetical protein